MVLAFQSLIINLMFNLALSNVLLIMFELKCCRFVVIVNLEYRNFPHYQLKDDSASHILPNTKHDENITKPTRKFNRLRAIGNQIR